MASPEFLHGEKYIESHQENCRWDEADTEPWETDDFSLNWYKHLSTRIKSNRLHANIPEIFVINLLHFWMSIIAHCKYCGCFKCTDLNCLGDPTIYKNFSPPDEAVEAVIEAVRSKKFDGYAPSTGNLTSSTIDSNSIYAWKFCSCSVFIFQEFWLLEKQ